MTAVKLGLMPPITGLVSIYGEEISRAGRIACAEVNANGGVLGRRLELVIEDDGSLPESAVAAAEKLVDQHRCTAIIGNLLSNSRIAVAYRVAELRRVPYLNFSFYEGSILSRYFFHFAALPNQQIDRMIPYMRQKFGPRMFFAGNNYEWPRGSIHAAKLALERAQGVIAGEEYCPIGVDALIIESLLDHVEASSPDVFVPYFAGIDQAHLLERFTERGMKQRIAVVMGHYDEMMASTLPPEVRAGFYSSNSYFMSVDTAKNRDYLSQLARLPGVDGIWPNGNGILTNFGEGAYICVKAFAQAANLAGSLDAEALVEALKTIDIAAPQGMVQMNPEHHHARVNAFLTRCEADGTFTIIEKFGAIEPVLPERYHHQLVSQRALLEDDIRLQARMLEQMSEGVLLISAQDGVILYTNAGTERSLGYEKGEMVGINIVRINDSYASNSVMHTLKQKGEWQGEIRNTRKDGAKIWCYATISTFTHPVHGEVWLAVQRNITEQKQSEEALRHSETKLRTLYESTSDAVMLLDEKGFFDCNKATLKMFGCANMDEFCVKHPADLSPPRQPCGTDSMTLANQKIATAMEKGHNFFEWMHKCIDTGKTFPAEVLLNTMELDGRKVLQATVRDITGRKNSEAQIMSLSRVYHLLSQVNEAIVRTRNKGELFAAICNAAIDSGLFRFIWIGMLNEQVVNPVAYAGLGDGYIVRLNIRLDDANTGFGPTGRAIREGKHIVIQDIENDPDMASWRDEAIKHGYLASAAFPVHEAGDIVGSINVYAAKTDFFTQDIIGSMLNLASDVSFALDAFAEKKRRELAENEVKQMNVELEHRVNERTSQLEAANRELESFSYSVSHDLRAPLRSIDGFSRNLSRKYHSQFDATGQDWLERICRASQHMGRLIDDMLQLSKVTRGTLKREPVDLSNIAESVMDELKKATPERQVRCIIQPGLKVLADTGLMRSALDNLLGNAFKFTGKKMDAEIEFGASEIDGQKTFFVRDNGDGFNMDYAHKLFGAFQRLHSTREFEGTGIGLATVQRVIHRHKGKVWAESAEGQGATFYFTLP